MTIENGETCLSVRTELNAALALVATAVQPLEAGTITGTTSIGINDVNKAFVCSGSSSYTVTLPDASLCQGKELFFTLSATALITLDGYASQTIDGETTKVLWTGESLLLRSNGSGWNKLGGVSILMKATLLKSTETTLANATITKILVDQVYEDNAGVLANIANNRLVIARKGKYSITAMITANADALNAAQIRVQINGAPMIFSGYLSAYSALKDTVYVSLNVGDVIELYTYHASGAARTIYGASGALSTSITVMEQV